MKMDRAQRFKITKTYHKKSDSERGQVSGFMMLLIVQLLKTVKDSCASSFYSFQLKYHYCKPKCGRRFKCVSTLCSQNN